MIRRAFCVLLILVSSAVHGGVLSWTTNGPESGIVSVVRFDPSNPAIVFAGVRNVGIFRSTDGGLTWSLSNGGIAIRDAEVIAIDPMSSSTIYVGSSSGDVYKSTNGGTTWAASSNGLFAGDARITALVIDPVTPSTLYVSTTSDAVNPSLGVQKSTNGGASWSDSGGASLGTKNVYCLAIDRQNPSIIYAGGLFDNSDRPMFKSTNGGASWVSISTSLTGFSVDAIGVDPLVSGTLLVSSIGNIRKSTNGGASWSSSSSGLPFSTNGYEIVYEKNSSSNIWYATASDVFRSTNGGASWTGVKIANKRVTGLDVASDGLVVAGTADSGLYRRPSGASAWTAANSGVNASRILSLAVDPGSGAVFAGTDSLGLFRSRDYGRSWEQPTDQFRLGNLNALAIDPQNASTMYAGTFGGFGIYKSTDGGTTWSSAAFLSQVNAIAIDPVVTSTLYAGSSSGVSKSTNGGSSFNSSSSGLPTFTAVTALAVDPVSTMTVYAAVTSQGLFKSTDGGANWVKKTGGLTSSDVRAIVVDRNNAARVFAGTNGGGVFRSSDRGESWSASNTGLTTLSVRSLWLDPADSQAIYAGTASGGVFHSTDGGGTWTVLGGQSPGLSIVALSGSADGNVIHAGLNGGVWSYQFRPFEPRITIKSPIGGSSITNGARLFVEIENFTLDCSTSGASGQARGHWRIDVDGTLDSTGCTETLQLSRNYALGNHSVRVSLRNPDDSVLTPPVESTVSVTIVESLPKRRSVRK